MFCFSSRASTTPTSIAVLVADPSGPWRDFIRVMFAPLPEIRLVGIESNGIDAMEQTRKLNPDVILIDLHLPGLNGFEAVRTIRNSGMSTKVLIVSIIDDREVVRAALREGASGYIHKLDFGTEIIAAIRATLQGKIYLSSEIERVGTGE
jgi:DNA-binding NarL/FixJ family response regulator